MEIPSSRCCGLCAYSKFAPDDEPQCQAGKLTEACFEAWIGLLYYKTDMDGINQSKINNCVFRKILHARLLLVFAGRE
jgi:hypothetical protein